MPPNQLASDNTGHLPRWHPTPAGRRCRFMPHNQLASDTTGHLPRCHPSCTVDRARWFSTGRGFRHLQRPTHLPR